MKTDRSYIMDIKQHEFMTHEQSMVTIDSIRIMDKWSRHNIRNLLLWNLGCIILSTLKVDRLNIVFLFVYSLLLKNI